MSKIILALSVSLMILPLISLAVPLEDIQRVQEQQGSGTLGRLVAAVEKILNLIIGLLFALATVYFLWGVVQYVVGAGGETKKLEQGKQHMVWGIVGMVIMLGAWGIVNIIKNFLLGI